MNNVLGNSNSNRLLGLIIGLLLIFPVKVNAASGVGLRLDPASLNLGLGEQKRIEVMLDAGTNQIVGVDVVVRFDANKLTVVDAGSRGIFDSQTGKKIDNAAGVVRLSLSNDYGRYTQGTQDIGWIDVVAKNTTGNVRMDFDFTVGSTADTNVVTMHGQDILEQVAGSTITIYIVMTNTPTPGPTTTVTPTANPTLTVTPSPTKKAGGGREIKPTKEPSPTKLPRDDRVRGESTESSELIKNTAKSVVNSEVNWKWIILAGGLGVLGVGIWLWFRYKEL